MNRTMTHTLATVTVALLLAPLAAVIFGDIASAAEPTAFPGLRKLMDTPLRDTSICRGPDGTWYLTGTVAPFWAYNEGIKLWKSKDLVNWEPLGFVWKYGASPWHKPYLEKKKPLWAPEIHYLKGAFWLTYSIPGWDGSGRTSGCGLLKSTTGKAEGPYEDVQPNERLGDEIDASLFQDDDGAVYFLWHSGKIAKMKPDMSGLAEPYRWLKTTATDPNPQHHSGLCAGIFGKGSFDHVGFEGVFIFKADGRYHLSCAEQFEERYSCMVATSTNLFGPYSARYEAIPHGGHNMFFKDEHSQWWSSYFGSDKTAPWRERPGIVPIEFSADGRVQPRADSQPSGLTAAAATPTVAVMIQADQPGKKISPDLFGIFFEDINYAADGGLYAELVQNRSFEYSPSVRKGWHALTAWDLVQRDGGHGSVAIEKASPLNGNNLHYAVLTVEKAGAGVGLQSGGFGGIPLKAEERYNVSLFARQLEGTGGPLSVRLENRNGTLLGEATLPRPTSDWSQLTATIQASETAADAWLVVLATGEGRVALDMISLFPQQTFRNRPNGLRSDLAQVIADLRPKFVRFPGGCLVHGDGLENMYRWKDTIGPVEQRRGQPNIWRYHQSLGLGYFEYFQFCEDIGAKPLPVVPAGVCCQNSGASVTGKWGEGQRGLPLSEMPSYVQEVLDLIEYANGPVTSIWGSKRAAAGHSAPFGLEYLGVGNEEHITPVFQERFQMIYETVKARHPEITVIGTAGPFHSGEDYDAGWKIADELKLPMVDEHYYEKPEWFLSNLRRYDAYDRTRSKVYLGEYAAHEPSREATLRSALAEAAFMANLERNGDVVRMASYAPLLGKIGNTQWNPNLIYFTNTAISPTINYYVQQMFSQSQGDVCLPTTVEDSDIAASSVRDSATGDLILKLVNTGPAVKPLRIEISGAQGFAAKATKTVLTGEPLAVNHLTTVKPTTPESAALNVGPVFDYEMPAHSLTVVRMKSH